MLNKDDQLSDASIQKLVSECDSEFRLNFQDLIKESKRLTHKLQYLCYENKSTLLEAEECARNCFKPLLYSKLNITTLIENQKEKFEKCLFNAKNTHRENQAIRKQTLNCLIKYKEDLNGLKDEAEYIYKGYMKNYDDMIKEYETNLKE
jgi:hypothetical protein